MITRKYSLCSILFSMAILAEASDSIPDKIQAAAFSGMHLSDITPPGWRSLDFDSIENKTAYFLTRIMDKTVVQAVSHTSASAYFKKINIPPKKYPLLKWHWKVENILSKGNVMTKEGDDYPARIYISFEYDPERLSGMDRLKYKLYNLVHDEPPPLAVINYVWGNHAPIGTIVPNAYSNRVKMIVVQSGEEHTKKWLQEEHNIYEDYKKAFGEEPGNISGIAIMTDTDNTGESATAYYGDIVFHSSSN